MFDNIGGKIKALAKVMCILGIIVSVIMAFVTWFGGSRYGASTFLPGLITLVVGCLGSWVGSFFTYGFGQLIESTEYIASQAARK